MNKFFQDYKSLTDGACDYLKNNLNYSIKTIGYYERIWNNLRVYMFGTNQTIYNKDLGKNYLISKFGSSLKKDLPRPQQNHFLAIKFLNEFSEFGRISIPVVKSKYPLKFDGDIGRVIESFINEKTKKRLSRTNIQEHQRCLHDFLKYCELKKIQAPKNIDLVLILKYIKQYHSPKKTNMTVLLRCLRGFTKYLFLMKFISVDISIKIPKEKKINQPKLPSVYDSREIKKLLHSVDRSSVSGLRNFAIILMATRLGLRASDIANIKLDDIKWDINQITIYQVKTGKHLILPLFADIGNAIIDYLKYGRPESLERHVFLKLRPPCGPLYSSNIITHIVQRAFKKSGIDISNRKFGSHSLRHSLAYKMLKESTAINIISEVLGHESSESTTYYLRIDLESMKKCTLAVPLISIKFYQQKGGAFYV